MDITTGSRFLTPLHWPAQDKAFILTLTVQPQLEHFLHSLHHIFLGTFQRLSFFPIPCSPSSLDFERKEISNLPQVLSNKWRHFHAGACVHKADFTPWSLGKKKEKKLPERNKNAGERDGSSRRRMRVIVTRRSPCSSRGAASSIIVAGLEVCASRLLTRALTCFVSPATWGFFLRSYLLPICQKKKNGGGRLEPLLLTRTAVELGGSLSRTHARTRHQ